MILYLDFAAAAGAGRVRTVIINSAAFPDMTADQIARWALSLAREKLGTPHVRLLGYFVRLP